MNLSRCAHCGAVAHYAKSVTDLHLCWSIQCSDCGIATPSYSRQELATNVWNSRHISRTLLDFYNRVCDRAESNMEATGTVSGAHWNAMRQELVAMGIEVTR